MRIEMSQAVNLRNTIQQSAGNSGLRGVLKLATCQLRKLHDINHFTLHTGHTFISLCHRKIFMNIV